MDPIGNKERQDFITELTQTFDQLDLVDLALLKRMATALNSARSLTGRCRETDEMFDELFCRSFGRKLVIQHLIFSSPLMGKSFEYALVEALQASDKQVQMNLSSSSPGADVVVSSAFNESVAYSLKTASYTAATEDKINISKLMDLAETRDCSHGQQCINVINSKVLPRLNLSDKLLILRYPKMKGRTSADNAHNITYELYEFPGELLRKVSSLKAENFARTRGRPDTQGGPQEGEGWNAVVSEGDNQLFIIGFTSGQVTIKNLRLSNGTLCGTWSIPNR